MTIKKTPADFQVEEVLRAEFMSLVQSEPAGFALLRLRKEGLATPEAVARLARELGLRANSFAYAGLKDKHASTQQHITLKLEGELQVPESASGQGWQLTRLGFVARALSASDIARNRFRIVLRNLTPQQCADMDQAIALLRLEAAQANGPITPVAEPQNDQAGGGAGELAPEAGATKPIESPQAVGQLRIVNYFGEQRFGSARHHQGFLAKHLIRGDFEGALKLAIATEARKDRMDQKVFKRTLRENWGRWKEVYPKLRPCPERKAVERLVNSGRDFRAAFCALPYLVQQLSVYAYQSYLWNETARRLIEQQCGSSGQVLLVDGDYGQMLFPPAAATPAELGSLLLPLLARKTELTGVWKQAVEETLAAEGIELRQLEIPGVRRPFFGEEPRALFFTTDGLHLSAPEPDETAQNRSRRKRLIEFALPAGSYATVLLHALGH